MMNKKRIFLFSIFAFIMFSLSAFIYSNFSSKFGEDSEMENAEKELIQDIDKIFEDSLSKVKQMDLKTYDKENKEPCMIFDEDTDIIENHFKDGPKNTRTDCVAEAVLSRIKEFKSKMLVSSKDDNKNGSTDTITSTQGERPESVKQAVNFMADRRTNANEIFENLTKSLDIALERYDTLRSYKIYHLHSQKKEENLKQLQKEMQKMKDNTDKIFDKIVNSASISPMKCL